MPKKDPIDPSIPLGNNNLASDTMFKERSLYRNEAYTHPHVRGQNLWYGSYGDGASPGKILYGRVDPKGFPVYPAEENLKQLNVKGKTIFVLNFVADAFHDLQRYWSGKITRDPAYKVEEGPLKEILPHQGWLSVHKSFHATYETNYDIFTNHKLFLSTPRDEKIVNFDGFLSVFAEYCETQFTERALTRSAYMTSKFGSPHFSGLMIDIVENPEHGDDYAKYVGYVQDQNFSLYVEAAKRFGFAVDINAPWRLIADIASPPMKAYLKKYGVSTLKQVFKSYYIPAYKYDIDILRFYARNMYNSYVVASPNVRVRTRTKCGDGNSAWRLVSRPSLTIEEFDRRYPPRWWVRFYVWLRGRESRALWDQVRFEQIVKKALFYEKHVNIEEALLYINNECKDHRRQLHGLPTLSKEEVDTIVVERSFRGPNRPAFKF